MLETFKPTSKINQTPPPSMSKEKSIKDPQYEAGKVLLTKFLDENGYSMPQNDESVEDLVNRFGPTALTRFDPRYQTTQKAKEGLLSDIIDFMQERGSLAIRQDNMYRGTENPMRKHRIETISTDEAPKSEANPEDIKFIDRLDNKTMAWDEHLKGRIPVTELGALSTELQEKINLVSEKYSSIPKSEFLITKLEALKKRVDGLIEARSQTN